MKMNVVGVSDEQDSDVEIGTTELIAMMKKKEEEKNEKCAVLSIIVQSLNKRESVHESAPQTPGILWMKSYASIMILSATTFQFLSLIVLLVLTLGQRRDNEEWFWYGLCIKNFILFSAQYVLGRGVMERGWIVSYTRKIVHVLYFLLPFILDVYLPMPEQDEWLWAVWNVHIIMWFLLLITKPVRRRFKLVRIFYAAVDRPEDRGLTQIYTIIQVPLSIVIIAGFAILFSSEVWDHPTWTLCPIIAVTFGDGLAEPVARFWDDYKVFGGTHKYRTRGLFAGDRLFTRSVEGSATVFFFTMIAVLFVANDLTEAQLAFLLCVLPITMTILEMVAPHSMDNPFLLLWGFVCMAVAYAIGDMQM